MRWPPSRCPGWSAGGAEGVALGRSMAETTIASTAASPRPIVTGNRPPAATGSARPSSHARTSLRARGGPDTATR